MFYLHIMDLAVLSKESGEKLPTLNENLIRKLDKLDSTKWMKYNMVKSKDEILKEFYEKISNNQRDLEPEIAKLINENLWDII